MLREKWKLKEKMMRERDDERERHDGERER